MSSPSTVRKPAVVCDVDMLQRLQKVRFKIPNLEDKDSQTMSYLMACYSASPRDVARKARTPASPNDPV
jgi:hypothetical protein